jgi:hypothetical protein
MQRFLKNLTVMNCRRHRQEDHKFKVRPGKVSKMLSQKQKIKQKGWGCSLPHMHDVLGSISSTEKKKN